MKTAATNSRRTRAKPRGKRRRAREMAVQMLYQLEIGGRSPEDVFVCFDLDDYLRETEWPAVDGEPPPVTPTLRAQGEAAFAYAQRLVAGVVEHGDEINNRIRFHAENWRLERMPTIDRNILRVAIYEMLFREGIPKVVIVDEAIELAKKFGAENSSRFINGLLDGVLKASREASRPEREAVAATDRAAEDGGKEDVEGERRGLERPSLASVTKVGSEPAAGGGRRA